MIPDLSLRGMAVMGAVSLALILAFAWRRRSAALTTHHSPLTTPVGQMFFLGAGFMLVETKAVVNMALLFGSTWIVNAVVFSAILIMILLANILVLVYRPQRVHLFYLGLLAALALNLLPLDLFLGLSRPIQVTLSCLLVSAPVFFAGIIFAISFSRVAAPNYALGANIAGSILGGLAEYTSMVVGFQYLMLLGIGFYGASWLFSLRHRSAGQQSEVEISMTRQELVVPDRLESHVEAALGLPRSAGTRSDAAA
jgi:hypothetical protein